MAGASAIAQECPNKLISAVVGFPPGGGSDTTARIVNEKFGAALGSRVVVENQPGANGLLALKSLMTKPADGCHLVWVGGGTLTISPHTNRSFSIDVMKDIVPVGIPAKSSYILVVANKYPFRTVKEFIDYGKANPGKLSFGSAGIGSTGHLLGEWLGIAAGVKAVHVPYKGDGPALQDLIGGQLDFAFLTPATAMQQVIAGKIKGLAVTSPERRKITGEIPTMVESGVKDFISEPWNALVAPAGTPPAVVERLIKAMNVAAEDPSVVANLATQGLTPKRTSLAEMRKTIEDGNRISALIVKEAKIPVE